MAEAEADGDRVIELVSAGLLYLTGEWERKYWSCSRLFGYINAPVQRLLRELLVRSTGAVELSLPHPVTSDADSPLTHKVEADVSDGHEDLPVFFDKTRGTAK
ncbi:hypothetical protein ABZP36_006621 [Zizania latifolia]